jgi:Domain of unknown function (DUF6457)
VLEEDPMDEWIDELAAELGEDPLTRDEVVRLLNAARDVAHRVERKITPLASFLLGTAVGRAEGGGLSRDRALEGTFATLDRLLPPEPETAAPAEAPQPTEPAADAAPAESAGPAPAGAEPEPTPGSRGDEPS